MRPPQHALLPLKLWYHLESLMSALERLPKSFIEGGLSLHTQVGKFIKCVSKAPP